MIAGITRVRNEGLIFTDTLRHWLKRLDHVYVLDDASEDDTAEIAEAAPRTTVLRVKQWDPNITHTNTTHRKRLTEAAYSWEWVFCFDADERLYGELPDPEDLEDAAGVRFRLFDGYMTPERCDPYTGGPLIDLPRMWGPEYRNILMMFRPNCAAWRRPGLRQPEVAGPVIDAPATVKHYGKCLSVQHWEKTCDFYAKYRPQFAKKWAARKGKAIHTESDFGAALYDWPDVIDRGFRL